MRLDPEHAARVVSVELEAYVAGAVLSELSVARMEPEAARRALEVQALIARTYAMVNRARHRRDGFDLCATTHCQLYKPDLLRSSAMADNARDAAGRTRGLVVLYLGSPIQAVFHANCGGRTSDASTVWSGRALPYLSGVPDPFCSRAGAARWQWSVDAGRLEDALENASRTHASTKLKTQRARRARLRPASGFPIDIIERDSAGRATWIAVGLPARIIRGGEFRAAIIRAFGPASLKSTRFAIRRAEGHLVFEGTGSGHGVGLCQAGAVARAIAGQQPRHIIEYYFPGSVVGRIDPTISP